METEEEGEENKEDSEAEEVEKETEKTSTDHPLASLPGVAEGVSAALQRRRRLTIPWRPYRVILIYYFHSLFLWLRELILFQPMGLWNAL